MSENEVMRYTAEDGAVYAVAVVPPERDGYEAQYGVELVRTPTDHYGLEHEQRLRLGAYASWGSAEEHQQEVEAALAKDGLAKDGLDGLGENARRVAQMPYLDGQYLALVFPMADSTEDGAQVHLLYLTGEQVTTALVADGRTQDMENLCEQLDRAWAEGGNERLLDTAQHEAEVRGQVALNTLLFDAGSNANLPGDLPFTVGEGLQPFDGHGIGHLAHVDGGGTAHWFAAVENREPTTDAYELRYFRAMEMSDGTLIHDSYPFMPLPDDDPGSAWPLPALEMYLEKGDLYMAQQFAHDVADHYKQAFPHPLDLPALNPAPEYYFGYGVGPHNEPSLEAVKTWMEGSNRRFDTFTVAEYGVWDEAQTDEHELEDTLKTQGLEAAMNQAERMAVAGGYLDPHRTDGRVFFEDDAPPDPFTTERERTMEREMQPDKTQHDPEYTVGAIAANGDARLDVFKIWGDEEHERERLLIPQPDWETARANAETAHYLLDKGDVQGAMTLVELAGIESGVIDPQRDDPRLFTQGPPDRFETLAQRLEGEINPYWNTDGEKIEDPAQQPAVENPYWRLDPIPVNDPQDEPLGQALHMVVYPGVERDLDAVGSPAMAEDGPFRMLEMAHFKTLEAVDKFGKEFNAYLIPGLLDGPELAVEVARLEGLPAEWKTLAGDDLKAYQNAELTLTREPTDWHPYNPHAERDAQIAAEGLYTDPIQQIVLDNNLDADIDF